MYWSKVTIDTKMFYVLFSNWKFHISVIDKNLIKSLPHYCLFSSVSPPTPFGNMTANWIDLHQFFSGFPWNSVCFSYTNPSEIYSQLVIQFGAVWNMNSVILKSICLALSHWTGWSIMRDCIVNPNTRNSSNYPPIAPTKHNFDIPFSSNLNSTLPFITDRLTVIPFKMASDNTGW